MNFKSFWLFLFGGVISLYSGQISWNIGNDRNEFKLLYFDQYTIIEGSGHPVFPIGAPDLPGVILHFSIPPSATITSVTITDEQWIPLGQYQLFPRQPDVPIGIEPIMVGKNNSIYNEDGFYPATPLVQFNQGCKSGFQIAGVVYSPFRYNPVNGELQFLTEGTVVVNYQQGLKVPVFLTPTQIDVFKQDVINLVENKQDVDFNAPMEKEIENGLFEYIVITPDYLTPFFNPLIRWKSQKGIPAGLFSREWICSNYSGYDDMEKIRNFIKDYHQNHGLIYLVLAGDYDNLGARLIHSEVAFFNIATDMPSDLYFSAIVPYTDNWDANGNHIYGEYQQDSCDWYSDIYVGRFPVNTSGEVNSWISKLLTYEQSPPLDYLEKSLMAGAGLWPDSNLFGDIICDSIADNCLPGYWVHTKMYEDHNSHPDGFLDSLNIGFHWVHVAAHGNKDGVYWDQYPSQMLVSSMLPNLNNGMKLFILHSIACMPGWFDDYECLAEYIFNHQNGGSIAMMLNARYGIGDGILPGNNYSDGDGIGPAGWLDIWTAREVFQGGLCNIGRGHGVGKDHCIPIMDSSYHWSINELNLFGDPETQIYYITPDYIDATHADSIMIGNGQFPVNVKVNGNSVEGAVCCLTSFTDSTVLYRAYSDSSGDAVINYSISSDDEICLTVYAHNCLYYQDTLSTHSTEPFIAIIDFDSIGGGLNNQQINAGFVYEAYPRLVNYGLNPAYQVQGVLSTEDNMASVDPDTVNFGDINGYDTLVASWGYSIHISDSVPDQYIIPFDFNCWDDNDSIWESKIYLTVNSPNIDIISAMGPPLISPGDDIFVSLSIANIGSGDGSSIDVVLSCNDPMITIVDSTEHLNLLNSNDTTSLDSIFLVHVSDSIDVPNFVKFYVTINTHGGYVFRDSGEVGIGGVLFTEDFEQGDSMWSYHGSSSWHLTGHRSHSTFHSMYCGEEGTWQYSAPILNSRVILDSFQSTPRTQIQFWHWYEIADNSDKVQLQYTTDGGNSWELLHPDEGYTGTWAYPPYDSIYTGDYKVWEQQHVNLNYQGWVKICWLFFSSPSGVAEGYYYDDLTVIVPSGFIGVEEEQNGPPGVSTYQFRLSPAYPNPVRNRAIISYSVGTEGPVSLKVYDLTGREITTLINQVQGPGNYRVEWDGRDNHGSMVSSGTYFYRMVSGSFTDGKKLVVVR